MRIFWPLTERKMSPEEDQNQSKCVCLFLYDFTVPPVIVKEWCASKAKSALTPELVPALCFREWTCPNLRRLWLGRASEDRSRRTRAFLACMRSDCPALLNPTCVPSHLLLMCCVLRYLCEMFLFGHWYGSYSTLKDWISRSALNLSSYGCFEL